MTPIDQPIIGTSIVLVGTFNPAIIHPSWFARFEILPPSDLENVDNRDNLVLVSPDFTRFAIDWLRVQVTADHFELSTVEDDRVLLLRDVGVNIFKLLSHTPVSAMGVNRTAHFPLRSDGWDRVHSALAPADAWSKVTDSTALASLTVQSQREDAGDPGYVRVTVEPSQRFDGGVFIAVNDHHDLARDTDVKEAAPVLDILDRGWTGAFERHQTYTQFVLQLAEGA